MLAIAETGCGSYDLSLDLWTLGIFIYDLIVGHSPYKASSDKEITEKIRRDDYNIPNDPSYSSKGIIQSLLQKNSQQRPGFEALKNFEWLGEISWPQLEAQDPLLAPFQPKTMQRDNNLVRESPHSCPPGRCTSEQQKKFEAF